MAQPWCTGVGQLPLRLITVLLFGITASADKTPTTIASLSLIHRDVSTAKLSTVPLADGIYGSFCATTSVTGAVLQLTSEEVYIGGGREGLGGRGVGGGNGGK